MTGFAEGLLHPLAVPTHFMGMAALALLIAQQNWGRLEFGVYAAAVLCGLGAIAAAYVPVLAQECLLAVSAATGLLVALARPLPRSVGFLLAAAIGLALALDSPPEAISLRDANLALLGTAIGATMVLVAVAQGASLLTGHGQRTGVRVIGSWIAASALLALALRLAR